MAKIGNARYGAQTRKYAKLKDGESVFRILPPMDIPVNGRMGTCGSNGIWKRFYDTHYGYRNSQGRMRVFQSPLVKNRKTKMIEVPDAAQEKIDSLRAAMEKAKLEDRQAVVDKLKDELQIYNCEHKHYVNAMDTQDNIVLLKMCHRAMTALEVEIKKCRDRGFDPLSADNGRFFVFTRSGNGSQTVYGVKVLTRELNVAGVGMVQQEVVHKLDDAILMRLDREAADLDSLFRRPSSEEVARLVKEGVKAVDEVFGGDEAEPEVDDDSDVDMPAKPVIAAAPSQAGVATPAAATPPPVVATATQPTAAVPPVQPSVAPVVAPAVAPTPQPVAAPKAPAAAPQQQSDEDFLKSLGLG
jgi:hypothetical protein